MKFLRRLVFVLTTTVLFVTTAAPAWAAENVPAPKATRAWFYWIAPILMLSVLGLFMTLALLYFLMVARPKMRGR